MLELKIPGYGHLRMTHLVLDFNGTLACDGRLIDGVRPRILALRDSLEIHVLTADTFGRVGSAIDGMGCTLSIIGGKSEAEEKLQYIQKIGTEQTVCIGNGRNDRLMLKAATLGIAVIQAEGASVQALFWADAVTLNILDALDLLLNPLRLLATLRS
jgi:soluble P-type ATPase